MDINQEISEHAANEIKEMWGGRFPTWEEYKKAYSEGRVRANKTISSKIMNAKSIPKAYFIVYSIITLWLGFLLFPATVIAWFFFEFSAFWIIGGLFAAWFLWKVSREGHCEGMKAGAERDKEFYEALVVSGAFLFGPIDDGSRY